LKKRAGGSRIRRGLSPIAATLVAVAMIGPSAARADYEQMPEGFSMSGEPLQLHEPLAIAINGSGAGGVETGSIYVGGGSRVVRFSPGREGEDPRFREAWGWGIAEGGPANEFVRCGPAYAEIPEASRPPNAFAACKPWSGSGGGEEVGHFNVVTGLAINHANGDVYVLNLPGFLGIREHHLIEVFSPTGTPIGEGFGDLARKSPSPAETIAESPEKLHEQSPRYEDGIAVLDNGTVYVTDRDFASVATSQQARIMSFAPSVQGNFEHYSYTGESNDIQIPAENYVHALGIVEPNRLVAASKQQIHEYLINGGDDDSLLCSYELQSGAVAGMATNPQSGEVFYFREGIHGKVAHLGACDTADEAFPELQAPIAPAPAVDSMVAMGVNPNLSWSASRPAGVLYGFDLETKSGGSETGDVFAPAIAQPPAIEAESVLNTSPTSTTLQARIDPKGVSVIFHFQYMTESAYLANGGTFGGPQLQTAPPAEGALGGGAPGTAAAPVYALLPDTRYVFRVIARRTGCAEEPACETKGQTTSFNTYTLTPPGLPDGRAYELVSPADKHGGEVFPADWHIGSCLAECKPPGALTQSVFPMQSDLGGGSVTYEGFPFSPEEGPAVDNSYISHRTATGWQTTAMSPRALGSESDLAYSSSLDQGVIGTRSPLASSGESAPAGYANLYLQNALDPATLKPLLTGGTFAALSASARPYREPGLLNLAYAGHSPDFSAQYFEANDSLTLAGAYAPQPPDPGYTGSNLYEWKAGDLSLVNVLPGNASVASGASFASASPEANGIAANGERVFWTAGGQLYMREGGRTTREVHHPGTFITAAPDGLKVLLSDGCLYSLMTTSCTDLTQGEGGFLGIAGQSSDLSRIYFVATAALPGTNEQHEEAAVGEPNLYLYEAGGVTRFIATLASLDGAGGQDRLADWAPAPGFRTAEASPDGRYLAFGSIAQLTGYVNVGPCEQDPNHTEFISVPCKEVFLYDAATGRLTCPSCNPTGESPLGNSTLRRIRGAETREWLPQPRYLTDQGRLLFDSSDRLSARDTNGRVEDVYESEPAGVGSCGLPAGCISLVSPGTSTVDSNFLAMDESGANVFFTSRQRLVPADTDELLDVYDARIGGGFPGEAEGSVSQCRGEACQAPANPTVPPSSSTSSFQGSGNVKPSSSRACPKGKVKKKNGKCVKKRAKKKKKRARGSHKHARGAGHKQGGGR
jgi:hypothetical protein